LCKEIIFAGMEDEHVYNRHNKTLLLYHIVLSIKYRRKVITDAIVNFLKVICLEISERYDLKFLEIGYESDHVHFLVQSVPHYTVSDIVMQLKSITAKQLFLSHPEIRKQLCGGNL
jgi:REP element-mobilizing transposase RayT